MGFGQGLELSLQREYALLPPDIYFAKSVHFELGSIFLLLSLIIFPPQLPLSH